MQILRIVEWLCLDDRAPELRTLLFQLHISALNFKHALTFGRILSSMCVTESSIVPETKKGSCLLETEVLLELAIQSAVNNRLCITLHFVPNYLTVKLLPDYSTVAGLYFKALWLFCFFVSLFFVCLCFFVVVVVGLLLLLLFCFFSQQLLMRWNCFMIDQHMYNWKMFVIVPVEPECKVVLDRDWKGKSFFFKTGYFVF